MDVLAVFLIAVGLAMDALAVSVCKGLSLREPSVRHILIIGGEKAADGRATKIIVPSKIQEIAGLVKSITEVAADDEQSPAQ